MFLINIYLRFALIALFLIGGVVLSLTVSFWYALPLLLVGIILLLGYILLGTVQSAAQLMEKLQFVDAEKRLDLTMNPKFLFKPNRAYYNVIKGTIALNLKDNDKAEVHLKAAEELGLQSDDERAMVALQLANIQAAKGKWNQAQIYFRTAKKSKVTDPNLKDQIKQFEKALNNRGQMKHLRQGGKNRGMMQRGGKSRRPKIR